MHRKFPSIAHPDKYGYAYDSDTMDFNASVSDHFRQFETCGDGMTQHSRDWSITREYLTDYLYSLATALLADEELANTVRFTLSRGPDVRDIEFAASVVFKAMPDSDTYEAKNRYYSMEERKVTSNDAKRHDKRYEQVASWQDGSAAAIFRMTLPSYARDLERLEWAMAVHDWCMDPHATKRPYMTYAAVFLKWTEDHQTARQYEDSLECTKDVCESYRLKDQTARRLASYGRGLEQAKQEATSAESAA